MDSCPPLEKLQRLVTEELAADEFAGLEAHVEVCPDCQQTLEQMTAESHLRGRRAGSAEPKTRSVDMAGDSASPSAPGAADAAAADIDEPALDFLAPTTRTDSLGRLGHYEVLEVLGRGGFGIVFRAFDDALQRVVAIKVLAPKVATTSAARKRFLQEAWAAAQMRHENVVQIHAVEEQPLPYLVMALVEGQSLAQRVAQQPLESREAARLVRQVAEAVAYAHAQGVVHRDLKPGNILLDAAGQPHVTDFGLAKRADADSSLTQAGQVMGTPSYMPPEQAEGKMDQVGPLADLYSLGATLYCLLTGRPPFQAASMVKTLKQVVEREPVPPRQLNPGIDRDLETICLKCLEKRPEKRYGSAAALAEDLGRYLEDRPIQARPVGELEKVLRWCRRNRVLAGSIAGVLVIFLAAFVLVSWSYWRAEDARANEVTQRQAADQARDQERWERYRANISAAASALQLRNIETARRHLDGAAEQHRNWEWHHLCSQLDGAWAVGSPSDDSLWLTPCRARYAWYDAAPRDGIIRLLDPLTGNELGKLPTRCAEQTPYIPSPTGTHVAYVDPAGMLRIWEVRAGRESAAWPFSTKKPMVMFSPAGNHLVTGADDRATRLLSLEGKELAVLNKRYRADTRWAFSADSRRVACVIGAPAGYYGDVGVWETHGGRRIALFSKLDDGKANAIALSPDGSRMLTGGYETRDPDTQYAVRVWDVASGKQLAIAPGHLNYVTAVDFSPDGTRVASASTDQTARIWDATTLHLQSVLRGHAGPVQSVLFSPDGKRLLTSSEDRSLRIWDAVTGEPITVLLGHGALPPQTAFSRDGAYVISRDKQMVCRFWDIKHLERNVLRGHRSYVYDVAVSPDGMQAASAAWDGTVRLWDLDKGTAAGVLPHTYGRDPDKIVGGVAFSPDGKWIATVPRNGTVCVWDRTGRLRHTLKASTGGYPVHPHVAFNRQGTLMAQGGDDGILRLWDPATGAHLADFPASEDAQIVDAAFSRDGNTIVAAHDHVLHVLDLPSRKTRKVLTGHTDILERVACSHDGRRFASGGRDGTVRIWDAETFNKLAILSHDGPVYGLDFSPDDTRLATGCGDNTIRLWDLTTYQEVAELRGHTAYVHAVAFTPEGSRLISGSGDFTVRIWDTKPVRERANDPRDPALVVRRERTTSRESPGRSLPAKEP